jgi:hypothetical protein
MIRQLLITRCGCWYKGHASQVRKPEIYQMGVSRMCQLISYAVNEQQIGDLYGKKLLCA